MDVGGENDYVKILYRLNIDDGFPTEIARLYCRWGIIAKDVEGFNHAVSNLLEEAVKRYRVLRDLEDYSIVLVNLETVRRVGGRMGVTLTDDEVERVAERVVEGFLYDASFWDSVEEVVKYVIIDLKR